MDGFKNTTRTHYMKGGSVGERKIGRVMEEFTKGKLHSGSKEGPKVKSTKQAVAIALNEARAAGAKIPRVKKARGGMINEGISTRPTTASGRRMTDEELGMTPGGVDPAKKKAMPKVMGAMSEVEARAAKKKPKVMSDLERARMMVRPLARKEGGGVPAHSDRPLIRRKTGGLAAMPKGKC
jgi:hypothetical protein